MQRIYLLLCVLGTVLPYSQFVQFLIAYGFDANLFVQQLLANSVSTFAWADVLVSSLVVWVFVFWEGSRLKMSNLWLYVVCNLLVGVSLALPLFLFMRQRKLDQPMTAPVV